MKLLEHEAKSLLGAAGIPVPSGDLANTSAGASEAAQRRRRVVVKAQVHSGGRGKAGGIVLAETPDEARAAANRLLGAELLGETVESVLIEDALEIATEAYVAVAVDTSVGRPVLLWSAVGGVDIESHAEAVRRLVIEPGQVPSPDVLAPAAAALQVDTGLLSLLVGVFNELDALLVEINPLVCTGEGAVIAADAKIELDDAAAYRQEVIPEPPTPDVTTHLELRAAELGLRLIELGGDVAILANGAGLTMATMDAVVHLGGTPANFLEIGGDAYTKAVPALELVLAQQHVASLVVNFCGAFARCDVMTAGVVDALEQLQADLPVFFSVHGTGQEEARTLLRERLGIEPFERMSDAVAAAVAAAKGAS